MEFKTEIDSSTGLVKLPEGYFWKVKKVKNPHDWGPSKLYAMILIKKAWIFNLEVDREEFYTLSENRMEEASVISFERHFDAIKDKMLEMELEERLLGDYPPKSIAEKDG